MTDDGQQRDPIPKKSALEQKMGDTHRLDANGKWVPKPYRDPWGDLLQYVGTGRRRYGEP